MVLGRICPMACGISETRDGTRDGTHCVPCNVQGVCNVGAFLSTGPPGKSSAYVLDCELTNWYMGYDQFVARFCSTCELAKNIFISLNG